MIDIKQLREQIIRPALRTIRMHSPEAEELVFGTGNQESGRYTYLRQLGDGPAMGFWQMEPATHNDIFINYVNYRPHLRDFLRTIEPSLSHEALIWNLRYGAAMCRIQYARAPETLPAEGDIENQGKLWKLRYNTPKGAGTVAEYVTNYRAVIRSVQVSV